MPDKPPPFLDPDPWRASPARRKPEIPGAAELAAMIRDGVTVEELAEYYGRTTTSGIRQRLSTAGWSAVTGHPVGMTPESPLDDEPRNGRVFEFPEWMLDANCSGTDPELFFPEKGGSTRQAKAICARCTVQAECLDYGLELKDQFGIFGGLAPRQRRPLQRPQDEAIHENDQESA